MILTDVKEYFARQKTASLTDLAVHFKAEPDTMRGMLDQWILRGKVRELPREDSCSNCCGCECNSENTEIYQWLE